MGTSLTPGTTLVTAVLGGVTSAAVTLTVTPATLVSIAITPTGPSIPVAGTEQFIATGTYSDSSTQILTSSVTWASHRREPCPDQQCGRLPGAGHRIIGRPDLDHCGTWRW